ncbi:Plant-specific GATA-type zinc finger transcription factor family protein isoform 2 [Anopheles sinensis]|uniref:Plant-specific GATA-type zinc finger transcription factor family protein isoform 2 n=1 Tax=Anopheles sinensis TaxID=74873 RepID=A0A084WGC7_ANOSI|nr:Plant-specific GATA-type zinc finger transcription factor family protein isoform 2 [Anopheles sinensis]
MKRIYGSQHEAGVTKRCPFHSTVPVQNPQKPPKIFDHEPDKRLLERNGAEPSRIHRCRVPFSSHAHCKTCHFPSIWANFPATTSKTSHECSSTFRAQKILPHRNHQSTPWLSTLINESKCGSKETLLKPPGIRVKTEDGENNARTFERCLRTGGRAGNVSKLDDLAYLTGEK